MGDSFCTRGLQLTCRSVKRGILTINPINDIRGAGSDTENVSTAAGTFNARGKCACHARILNKFMTILLSDVS